MTASDPVFSKILHANDGYTDRFRVMDSAQQRDRRMLRIAGKTLHRVRDSIPHPITSYCLLRWSPISTIIATHSG
jgi:hypothetical protein